MTSIREHVHRLSEATQKALFLIAVLALAIASVELGSSLHGAAAWITSVALWALFAVTYLVVRRRPR